MKDRRDPSGPAELRDDEAQLATNSRQIAPGGWIVAIRPQAVSPRKPAGPHPTKTGPDLKSDIVPFTAADTEEAYPNHMSCRHSSLTERNPT